MTQFSLFGAEAAAPSLEDLDGLLLAGAQWVRGSGGARLSVVVADRWRADALAGTFGELGVGADDTVAAADERFAARTAFSADLLAHADRWTRGARQAVPAGFELGAGGLRMWTIAAGRRDGAAYLLGTAPPDDPMHQIAGAQLSRLGVAAVSLSQRPGPGWRITSARRLRRFAELVGRPPDNAGQDWP